MERISAASNLIIEVEPERWRLLTNGGGSENILIDAAPGGPLRYDANFGSRRHLPENGTLPREDIQRVVLGWSDKDNAWHLGLVLKGDLVDQRGSRWCGLAHWNDPLANQYQGVAAQAGQALADQVKLPFTLIPPPAGSLQSAVTSSVGADGAMTYATPARIATATLEPVAPPIPQPNLPLVFDLWTLRPIAQGQLELALASSWVRSKLMRVLWNIVWLAVFILLTATTLTSGIALPRPEILVYFGFASITLLVLLIFYNLYEAISAVNHIVFEAEGVRWMRGKRTRHAIPVDQIAAVYVSQVVTKAGKRGKSAERRVVQYGEINLLLKDGKFKSVLVQRQPDDAIPVTDDPINEEVVASLTEYNARTRLQSAGLVIAQTLHLPAEYDKRLK